MKIMKETILVLFGVITALSLPNPAPYIKARNRPLNIAHRGLASILPENTLEAFEAALYQGADFIELDVVYTIEKIALVMHDPYLSRITNVKDFKQFQNRQQTRVYNDKNVTDWWVDTFSISQLRKLGIKQDQAPGRITIFDYKFKFPTLDQVVKMIISFNKQHNGTRNPDRRLGGILIQAKDSQMYRDLYKIEIGQTILQVLRDNNVETIEKASKLAPMYLHSFDYGTIKYWAANTELPRNYLLEDDQKFDLDDVNKYATGIGYQDNLIWDYDSNKPNSLLQKTRDLGMQVHIWTFKDDQLLFNANNNIEMYSIAQKQLKLDGVITQFADIYAPISQLYRSQVEENRRKKYNHIHYNGNLRAHHSIQLNQENVDY